ncbi:MAG: hypothetical protein JWO98_3575, partial [Frankiales bacterium]|nr:hypothetical protein [Frankiales bacterium]
MTEHHEDGPEPTTATGMVGRSIEDFVRQLRTFTDRARALAQGAVPSRLSLPAL